MLSNFNEEAQYILLKSKEEMIDLKHPYIGTEHLVLSLLKNKDSLSKRLEEYGLTYNKFKNEILNIIGTGSKKSEFFLYTPLLKKVIENSMLDAKDNNNGVVTPEHLLSSLLESGEGIAIRILIGMNIDIDKLYDEFAKNLTKKKSKSNKKILIDLLGTNLTEQAKNKKLDPVIGRDKEIKKLVEILCRRNKNNPILIGEAGVGKTAIVEGLATLIAEKKAPILLENKRIISIDMATLVSGTKYRGEFEERMQKIIKEVEQDGNIILFIDEIHTLVGAGGAEGAIDASNILKPALARGSVNIIGATTTKEYKKYIREDKALSRRFRQILVEEPNLEQTINILTKIKPIYEQYHNVLIPNSIIEQIVSLTDKYIHNLHNPDKSIDILDEVCSRVSTKEDKSILKVKKLKKDLEDISKNKNSLILDHELEKAYQFRLEESRLTTKLNELELSTKLNKKTITKKDIASIIKDRTNIPIYEILKETKDSSNSLYKKLSDNIIGQEEAIKTLINHTKKLKLGYTNNKLKSYLFVGPTGVGKTALAKLFANSYGIENNLIRLDMSEYSDITAINKIIGSSPGYVGYQDNNNIIELIKEKPTATILLDEIDKSHPNILNLLYQILDEGIIKDQNNNTINLNNNIIIMTSNIGYEEKSMGFTTQTNTKVKTLLKEKFSPSLINRIDNIITFNYLTKKDITQIITKKLTNLKQKYKDFDYSKSLIEDIIKESNYKEYGARRIDKIIDSRLENIIIDKIINKEKIKIETLKECQVN